MSEYMIIDGIKAEIEGEKNVLELARKVGIEIPAFCYDPELSIYGACRMCMFEDERGRFDAACSTIPRAGMVVKELQEENVAANVVTLLVSNNGMEVKALHPLNV